MDSPESKTGIEKSEGQRWLELIGEGHLVGTLIPYYNDDGRQYYAEEFPNLCGKHVRPIFKALENLGLENPEREELIIAMRSVLYTYLNNPAKGH